ncbi:hypothetical protein LCGC14_0913800, partial [marine sediment metagenome]
PFPGAPQSSGAGGVPPFMQMLAQMFGQQGGGGYDTTGRFVPGNQPRVLGGQQGGRQGGSGQGGTLGSGLDSMFDDMQARGADLSQMQWRYPQQFREWQARQGQGGQFGQGGTDPRTQFFSRMMNQRGGGVARMPTQAGVLPGQQQGPTDFNAVRSQQELDQLLSRARQGGLTQQERDRMIQLQSQVG